MTHCASPGAHKTYVSRLKKLDSKTKLLASLLQVFYKFHASQVEIDASCHPEPTIHWFLADISHSAFSDLTLLYIVI